MQALIPDSLIRYFERLNLRGKLTAVLLGIALMLGAAVVPLTYFTEYERISRSTRDLLEANANLDQREFELRLSSMTSLAESLANNTVTANALADSLGRETYLTPLLRNQNLGVRGADLSVVDFRGKPVAAIHGATGYGDRSVFLRMMEQQSPQAQLAGGRLTAIWPVKYRLTGQTEGGVVLDVPLDELLRWTDSQNQKRLEGQDRNVLFGSKPQRPSFEAAVHLRLPAPINALDLTLVIARDRQTSLAILDRLLLTYLGIGVIVLMIMTWLANAGTRLIAGPLGELAAAAEAIARSGRPQGRLPIRGNDEFSRLSAAFNIGMDRLAESYADLEQRVADRTREYEESRNDAEKAAEALRERELYLRATLDNLPFLFWLKDAESRFLAVNKMFSDACGLAGPGEVVGLTDYDVWPSDLAERYRADDFEVIANGVAKAVEEPVAGGSEAGWIETYKKPVIAANGTTLGTVGFARDISDRREAESRLRDRNEQLDAIFSLSPDGFVSFDQNRCVKYASPAFLSLVGLVESDVLGVDEDRFSTKMVNLCSPAARFPGFGQLRASELKVGAHGTTSDSQRPQRHLIELTSAGKRVLEVGLRSSRAESVSQILYFRDVTHETEVDRMKSEFLSTAAHELRTPMASIYGFTELLLTQDFDDAERHDFLETIFKQSDLMVAIINELLDLSRIEARRGKDFRYEQIDLDALIQDVIGRFKPPGDLGALAVEYARFP